MDSDRLLSPLQPKRPAAPQRFRTPKTSAGGSGAQASVLKSPRSLAHRTTVLTSPIAITPNATPYKQRHQWQQSTLEAKEGSSSEPLAATAPTPHMKAKAVTGAKAADGGKSAIQAMEGRLLAREKAGIEGFRAEEYPNDTGIGLAKRLIALQRQARAGDLNQRESAGKALPLRHCIVLENPQEPCALHRNKGNALVFSAVTRAASRPRRL